MGATALKLTEGAVRIPAGERTRELRAMGDSDVVQACLDGEEKAFGELVRRYDTRLLNFVYRTVGDRERAFDELRQAAQFGYWDPWSAREDLTSLHGDPEFESIIAGVREDQPK